MNEAATMVMESELAAVKLLAHGYAQRSGKLKATVKALLDNPGSYLHREMAAVVLAEEDVEITVSHLLEEN